MASIIDKIFNKKKKFAGLDIGKSSIKFMEIEGDDIYNAKLIHYAIEPIPKNLLRESSVENIQIISDLIKKCIKKSGSSNKNVVVCLSANATIAKKTLISDFDNEDAVQMQVESEIVKYFPTDINLDDVLIDYYTIGVNDQSPTDNDTLLIAGKKDKIDELLAGVESAGLTPAILDVDTYAINNLLRTLKGEDFLSKIYVFLDCSGNTLRMMVYKNGDLIHSKEIEIGGNQLTNDLMSNLGIDNYEEAEKLKITDQGDETYEMIKKQFLLNYAHEFVRALEYFSAATSIKEIEEIIITGGVSNMGDLPDIIKDLLIESSDIKLNQEPYVCRPINELKININDKISLNKFNHEEGSLFLVTGLAIRHFLRQY